MSSPMSKDDAYYRAFHTSNLGPMWTPTPRERRAFHVNMQEYVHRSQANFMPKTRTASTATRNDNDMRVMKHIVENENIPINSSPPSSTATSYTRDCDLTRPMNEGFHAVFTSGARCYINLNPGANNNSNNNNNNNNNTITNTDHADHRLRPLLLARESTIPSHPSLSSQMEEDPATATIQAACQRRLCRRDLNLDFHGLSSNAATRSSPDAIVPSGIVYGDVNNAPMGHTAPFADQQFLPEDEQCYHYAMPEIDQHPPPQFVPEYDWKQFSNCPPTSTSTTSPGRRVRIITRRTVPASGWTPIDHTLYCPGLGSAGTTSPHCCSGDSAYTTHTPSPTPESSSGRYSSHSNQSRDDDDDGYDGDDSSNASSGDESDHIISAGFHQDFSPYRYAEEMHDLQHMSRHSRSSCAPIPPPRDTEPRERRVHRQAIIHGDEYMRPEIEQTRYTLSQMRRLPNKKDFCRFCKNKGEDPQVYSTHRFKDSDGLVICPILQKYICPLCGATGYDAHTVKYCHFNEFDRRFDIGAAMDRLIMSME